jgi:hypothetical protein
VNLTLRGDLPEVTLAVNFAAGAGAGIRVIYRVFVIVSVPLAFVTFSETVKVSEDLAVLYVCPGFCCVELVPSPKVQYHDVGLPVD